MKITKLDRRHKGYGEFSHRIKLVSNVSCRWEISEQWLIQNYGVISGYYRYNSHEKSHIYSNGRWGINHERGPFYAPIIYFKSEDDLTWFLLTQQ